MLCDDKSKRSKPILSIVIDISRYVSSIPKYRCVMWQCFIVYLLSSFANAIIIIIITATIDDDPSHD